MRASVKIKNNKFSKKWWWESNLVCWNENPESYTLDHMGSGWRHLCWCITHDECSKLWSKWYLAYHRLSCILYDRILLKSKNGSSLRTVCKKKKNLSAVVGFEPRSSAWKVLTKTIRPRCLQGLWDTELLIKRTLLPCTVLAEWTSCKWLQRTWFSSYAIRTSNL